MRWSIFAGILYLYASAASAQDWATRDYCEVDLRPVTAEDFAPFDLDALERAAAEIPNGHGRFWRIESPDGAVSHLWGTYHVSAPQILDLPPELKTAIDEARILAVELDYTFSDREAFLTQYDVPGRYADPSDPFSGQDPLDLTFLGEEAEGWVYDRMYGWGTSEDSLYVLTYAGLAEILLSDPCEDYYHGTIPVQDDYILTLAHIAGAEIFSLEQPSEFFTDLSQDEDTAKAIVQVYASYLSPPEDQVWRIVDFQLYLDGRLGLLAALEAAEAGRTQGTEALERTDGYLLHRRNERFVERIAAELAQGGVLIAVGAGHLPGEQGLVTMLRNRGYDVSRVPTEGEVR